MNKIKFWLHGTSDSTITFTDTLSNINNALEGLNFVPNAILTDAASLTITTDLNDTNRIAIAVALVGTNGNDTIYGTVGDDIIYGLAGNDTIFYSFKKVDSLCNLSSVFWVA